MPGSENVRPANPGVKLTYDDLMLFPDDGKRHELIDGEHCVTPSPNSRHQEISGEAGDVLTTPLLPGLDILLARVFTT